MSRPSNQKCFKNRQAKDHISNLPDTILSHILSLVPTISAVKTSVLSKRWKHVWTEVPILDFTELPLTSLQRSYFRCFVSNVLLHNDSSYLHRLCFDISHEDDEFYVKSWLSNLAKREAREIIIKCQGSPYSVLEPIFLPTQLLSGERVVILKLEGLFAVDAPMSLHLPNLETIHLIDFCFPDDEFMKKLSLGSPLLKELLIENCCGITSKLYVEFLTLKRLEVRNPVADGVVIRAPSLRYLALEIILGVVQYDIGDKSSLEEANLQLLICDEEHMFSLLRKVDGVKTLRLVASEGIEFDSLKFPIFQNLTCLKLAAEDNTYKLLNCAPSLKSLIFESLLYADYYSFESEPVPKCVSCLESVEFPCFDDYMMRLVAYFLKNALVLKELKICMLRMHNQEREIDIYHKLLKLPRSSITCHVNVVRLSESS